MSIEEEENTLFQKWKKKRHNLIPDGVVDSKKYLECQVKVLYVLKEVNGGENWDLRKFLRDGAQWRTWNNIVRWQYGIGNINLDAKFSQVNNVDENKRKEYLKHIAVLNIKKEPGGASSKMSEIWSYSWEDRELIKNQIEIYNPDIIMCCGTGKIVQKRYLAGKFEEWNETKNGIKYKNINNCLIIDYYHPQNRNKKKEKLFKDLVVAISEATT